MGIKDCPRFPNLKYGARGLGWSLSEETIGFLSWKDLSYYKSLNYIENRSQNMGEQELAVMFRGFPGLHFHEHTIACMRTWNCDELRAHAKQRPLALTHV